MSRKTIAIPVEGDREYVNRVKRFAGANGLTIASVVRSAIDAYIFFASSDQELVHLSKNNSTQEK